MKQKGWRVVAQLCVLACAVFVLPAAAQTQEVKEKPPMYSYVSFWALPRAQWAELEKQNAGTQQILDKAMASGAIVAHGNDVNLVHQADGFTHDDWWSSMSMAGLLSVLDQFYKSGTSTSPVLSAATKHADGIFVSRYYNWKPGTYKDAYTHGAVYKLKADAPDEAVAMLSKNLVVPLLEKLLADGSVVEYEIDTEAVHSESPAMFYIFYICPRAEGLDKVNAAIRDAIKAAPLGGSAFGGVTESAAHRDYLSRTTAVYK